MPPRRYLCSPIIRTSNSTIFGKASERATSRCIEPRMSAKYWHRLSHETELWRNGVPLVAGADEAGCGPLAGPVVAAAVMFPSTWLESGLYSKLRGLNDSKQLTEEQREKFYCAITTHPEI